MKQWISNRKWNRKNWTMNKTIRNYLIFITNDVEQKKCSFCYVKSLFDNFVMFFFSTNNRIDLVDAFSDQSRRSLMLYMFRHFLLIYAMRHSSQPSKYCLWFIRQLFYPRKENKSIVLIIASIDVCGIGTIVNQNNNAWLDEICFVKLSAVATRIFDRMLIRR